MAPLKRSLGLIVLLAISFSIPSARADTVGNYLMHWCEGVVPQIENFFHKNHTAADILFAGEDVGLGRAPHTSFVMHMDIGTPARRYDFIVDIIGELVWTQCMPCAHCVPQSTPVYDPARSSTSRQLTTADCRRFPAAPGCVYSAAYNGPGTNTTGRLVGDTLLDKNRVPHGLVFGCSRSTYGFYDGLSGIVGLGGGELSLLGQLKGRSFSYCGTANASSANFLTFGGKRVAGVAYTTVPLSSNPLFPSRRYVDLVGITVGATPLDVAPATFAVTPDGSGGVLMDTSTPVTYLKRCVYEQLKVAVLAYVQTPPARPPAPFGLDLCFEGGKTRKPAPAITFHFSGGGRWVVPAANYLHSDAGRTVTCLTALPTDRVTTLGLWSQLDTHFVYDTRRKTLSFARTGCAAP